MDPQALVAFVELVHCTPLETLTQLPLASITNRLPLKFIMTFNDEEKLDAIWACLIVPILTHRHVVPRVFQLQASLTMLHRQDSVTITGSNAQDGKELGCWVTGMYRRMGNMQVGY